MIVIFTSVLFLEIKKVDERHEIEAAQIARKVVELTTKINEYYTESKYIRTGAMYNEVFPKLTSEINYGPDVVIPSKYNSLEKFISESQISHLVVDDDENRPDFLKEVFENEKKFVYLIKVYDSTDEGFSYHVKIFEIDYSKFLLEDLK